MWLFTVKMNKNFYDLEAIGGMKNRGEVLYKNYYFRCFYCCTNLLLGDSW
jgi:hypothetical protein